MSENRLTRAERKKCKANRNLRKKREYVEDTTDEGTVLVNSGKNRKVRIN